MALNQVTLNGKIPHFEGTFKPAEGEKKAFMSWCVSVKRDFKKADEQYYPEDLINFKAFGATAEFINKFFQKGAGIIITGRLQRDEDYEKDGQTIKGQMSVLVEKASFVEAGKASEASTTDSAQSGRPSTPAGRPAPAGRPSAPAGRPGVPGSAPARKGPWA